MDDTKSVPATGPAKSIVDATIAAGNFSTFVASIKAAGLTEHLSAKGPFTVFAPTDEAFRKLPSGAYDALVKDTAKLKTILQYHVIQGTYLAKDLKAGEMMTLQGSTFTALTAPELRVSGARVTRKDILASNGVIHAVDAVLVPRHLQLMDAAA
jgi:uncharacterized surface protein with fasciclin (FAS1) repeats